MYNFKKIKEGQDVTVADVKEVLENLPQNATFVVCGDDHFLVHVEEDDSVVNFDTNYMEDEYKDFDYMNIPKICPIEFAEDDEEDEESVIDDSENGYEDSED